MSSSDNSGSETHSQKHLSLENTGNAEVESFKAYPNEINSIIEHAENISENDNIEVLGDKKEHWVVKYRPSMNGAAQSSGRNDDFNILHEDEGVVREFLEEFEKSDEIEREDLNAVISQGRNISDIVAHMVDKPIKKSEGEWSNIVLAAEEGTGEPDEVVIHPTYEDNKYDIVAKTFRGGDKSRAQPAAGFNLEFYNEDFQENRIHNAFLTAIGDLMVGRGHETDSNVRNTELLMYTLAEIEEPIDPGRVDEVSFDLESEVEDNPAKADYNVKVIYDDGKKISGRVEELAYSSDLFEDLNSVEEYLQEEGYSNPAVSALEIWNNLFEAGIEANPFLSTDYDSSKNQRAD